MGVVGGWVMVVVVCGGGAGSGSPHYFTTRGGMPASRPHHTPNTTIHTHPTRTTWHAVCPTAVPRFSRRVLLLLQPPTPAPPAHQPRESGQQWAGSSTICAPRPDCLQRTRALALALAQALAQVVVVGVPAAAYPLLRPAFAPGAVSTRTA